MFNFLPTILLNQFQASICMLHHCIKSCPARAWENKIANATFRQIAYHTLFFTDYYLSPSPDEFQLRDLHHQGGDERGPTLSKGLSKPQTLRYLTLCRKKARQSLASQTLESLQAPSNFRQFSRCELHIYNIRHIQHHTGALAAHLRRIDPKLSDSNLLPWVGSGWR